MTCCSLGRWLLVALTLLAMAPFARGAKFVGIVSERSAPELAAAAHDFHESFPTHELILRTPQQLSRETDAAIAALWEDADAILFGAVFGETTPRLLRLLETDPPRTEATLFAVSGDRRTDGCSPADPSPYRRSNRSFMPSPQKLGLTADHRQRR